MPFSPSASGQLDRIELPLTMVMGPGMASLTVDVYSDAGGMPGVSLESVPLSGTIPANGVMPLAPLFVIDFADTLSLTAGQPYWIVIGVAAPLGGPFIVWNHNVVGDVGTVADRRNGGPGWNVFASQNLAAYRVFTVDGVGAPYCAAINNSTGSPGVLGASGSAEVASNDLILHASGLPANASTFFLTSRTQGFSANPGGSAGNLCLAGSIGRYVGGGQIGNSGAGGSYSLAVDNSLHPTPAGFVQVLAGETWTFQAWHRDLAPGGGTTSSFTNGLEIVFL
jgi:hypothetical protein